MRRRAGRFRSASRGRLPGIAAVPLTLGILGDLVEGGWRHLRVLCTRPDPRGFVPPRAGYPTIVPIAGIFERWDHLLPHLRRLNRLGYGVHPVPVLGRNIDSVDRLAAAVLLDLQRHELRDVVLLGSSKGGLTAKYAALRDPEHRIRLVVALSTPFKGSLLAAYGRTEPVAALSPISRQLIRLSRRSEADDRIVSIFSTFDQFIAVPTQVALGRNIEAVRVGHSTVLSSREVTEHIAREITRAFGLAPRLAPDRETWWQRLEGRRRDIARDYGFAVGWQLRALLPDAKRLRRWSVGEPGRVPVVLLPGVLERWHFLMAAGERLHRAGHPVFAVSSLADNRAPSPRQAELVAEFLEKHGLDDVIVVAHSKGGLIGKLAMLDRHAGSRIRGMVAVATPYSGSPYARFFVAPSIREFSPANIVIRRLSSSAGVDERIVSVFPVFDQHIPDGSALPGALANVQVPGTGHFRILSSGAVLDEVERWVEQLAAAPPRDGGETDA